MSNAVMVISFAKRAVSTWAGPWTDRGYSWIGVLVMAVWLGVVGIAGAQAEDRGALTGSVTDGQGAPIAEASVLVRSVATGSTRMALTAADGTFTVGELRYGVYQIRVTREGFSDAVVEVRLAAPSATLDPIRLAPGTIRESSPLRPVVPSGTQ
jgi:hemoglobin/transferrin/lactoferrin receptor protein